MCLVPPPVLAPLTHLALEPEAPAPAVVGAPVVLDDAGASIAGRCIDGPARAHRETLVCHLQGASAPRRAYFGAYRANGRGVLQAGRSHHGQAERDEEARLCGHVRPLPEQDGCDGVLVHQGASRVAIVDRWRVDLPRRRQALASHPQQRHSFKVRVRTHLGDRRNLRRLSHLRQKDVSSSLEREPGPIREGILLQIFLTRIVRKPAYLLIKITHACANSLGIPEYDHRTRRLLQIKAESDRVPTLADHYAPDLIEAIELLGATQSDTGERRIIESEEAEHMRQLITLSEKSKRHEPFTRTELLFLYEVNEPIQCFDSGSDPRIAELRDARDTDADLPILFDCMPEDIAHSVADISENTKAYVGKPGPGIFDALPRHIEYVYTKFPEERVKFRHIELGTGIDSGPAFKKAIEEKGMKVDGYAEGMLENPDFTVVGEHRGEDLVEVSVGALGFEHATRYDKICERAQELGLELCPAEVGPQLRLQYKDQPLHEWVIVAMKAISGSDGGPDVFRVSRRGVGLWLGAGVGRPGDEWLPGYRFVFLRPRK